MEICLLLFGGIPLKMEKSTIVASIFDENPKFINSLKEKLYFTTNITEAHFI